MGNYTNDSRVVLTLDAGGTNMVFGAMKGVEYVGEPITLPANSCTVFKIAICIVTTLEFHRFNNLDSIGHMSKMVGSWLNT